MPIPNDYEERVYAGVLGKIIGVYLGRPFEGWPHARIERELGEICYYVHERLKKSLVVSDDDISGTFTFVRALEDHGISPALSAEQIGQTWLNYLIEERTILWWGGMGNSTEHTAYLRLKHGMSAPQSGSIAANTREVAEQIGAQIFIDGWAMVAPGEPDLAVKLAEQAARVSHDGEAVYGAQVLAAMESAAFFESDMRVLLDLGRSYIPAQSIIAQLIADVCAWREQDNDWRTTFGRIQKKYGYDTYGGNCHMVPNHAVIILALLYGDDDFQKALMIANTAGWDTDCNSGNVGCLMGIKNGLRGIADGPDWRGPVADRIFKISADGADGVTDAVRETFRLCRIGRALLGAEPQPLPKNGARYHFSLPGSVQGFLPDAAPDARGAATVENRNGALTIHFSHIGPGRPARVGAHVYAAPDELSRGGYRMILSPSLFPGQTVSARACLRADRPIDVALYIQTFPEKPDRTDLPLCLGPATHLEPDRTTLLEWTIPDTGGLPVVAVGVQMASPRGASGALDLDWLTWQGIPQTGLFGPGSAAHGRPLGWTDGIDRIQSAGENGFNLIQNEGRGLLINGDQAWTDYRFEARISPHMAEASGIAVRAGGMRRFYALLLCSDGHARLVRCRHTDAVLAETAFDWAPNAEYHLALTARGEALVATIDGSDLFTVRDNAFSHGAVALVQTEGRTRFRDVRISPLAR